MELYLNLLQWGEGRDLSLLSLLPCAGHLLSQVRIPRDGRLNSSWKEENVFSQGIWLLSSFSKIILKFFAESKVMELEVEQP